MSSKLPNAYAACPCCGKTLDAATAIADERDPIPEAGDFSICLYCGTILEYEEDFFLHVASDDRLSQLNGSEPAVYQQLIQVRNAIQTFIRIQKAKLN
jgi:hypothetical protein